MSESLTVTSTSMTANGSAPEAVNTPLLPRIYARVCDAMADIDAVAKGRKNEFHGYQFRGIDDMLTMIHPVLAKHRLVLLPGEIVGDPKVVERASTKGKIELHVVVKVRWRLFTDDGSSIQCETLGEASDTGDKGCNKAMSASQKYAIIQIFSVPVAEKDRDTEERSPEFKATSLADVTNRLKPKPPEASAAVADSLITAVEALPDETAAKKWRTKLGPAVKALPMDEQLRVSAAFYTKFPDLKPKSEV